MAECGLEKCVSANGSDSLSGSLVMREHNSSSHIAALATLTMSGGTFTGLKPGQGLDFMVEGHCSGTIRPSADGCHTGTGTGVELGEDAVDYQLHFGSEGDVENGESAGDLDAREQKGELEGESSSPEGMADFFS